MTIDEAVERLVALARSRGGKIVAEDVEADPELSTDREAVSAAAHMLAGSTNVFGVQEPDGSEWFPYSELVFSDLR